MQMPFNKNTGTNKPVESSLFDFFAVDKKTRLASLATKKSRKGRLSIIMTDFELESTQEYVREHGYELCLPRNTPVEVFWRCLALVVAIFLYYEVILRVLRKK